MYDPDLGPDPALYRGLAVSEEVRLKRLDNTLGKAGHLVEHFNNWAALKWQPPDNHASRFASGNFTNRDEIRIGVDGKARQIDRDGLRRMEGSLKLEPSAALREGGGAREHEGHDSSISASTDSYDGDMLIADVEIVHGAEYFVPPNPRLKGANNCLDIGGSLTHLALQFVLKPGSVFPEWEVDLFGLDASKGYDIVCKNIQGGSKVVDCIPEYGGKICGDGFSGLPCYPVLASPVVELQEHSARIVLQISGDFRIEFHSMSPPACNL
jgi:hypothetical protein